MQQLDHWRRYLVSVGEPGNRGRPDDACNWSREFKDQVLDLPREYQHGPVVITQGLEA